MAGSEMNTHTLYLDGVIVAAAAYPSGLGYSMYTSLWGVPRQISVALLAMLALPFVMVTAAVCVLRPSVFTLTTPTVPWLLGAMLLVPVALACEFVIDALVVWRATGQAPRGVSLHSFWRPLPVSGHLLVALIAVGEELFYRAIWLGVLMSLGVAAPIALLLSSAAYGVNHLSFGGTSVASKSVTGLLYGAIYLAGGRNIALPIVAHVLQNVAVLALARPDHA
jgi:CAAX protease family protein